jgi:hypothetical protein
MSSNPPSGGRRAGDFPPWQAPPYPKVEPKDVRSAGLYCGEDDSLVVIVYNAVAGLALDVRLRTVMLDGRVVPQTLTITPTSARARFVAYLDIAECFLIGAAVEISSGAARRGQCFVQVGIGRGPAAVPIFLHTLISDYAVTDMAPSWPGGLLRHSVEGPGMLRSVLGTDQAAGAEISETVPAGARWRLRGLRAQLVTSATVATRRVHVFVDDGATKLFELAAADTQLASLTRNYNVEPVGFQRTAQDNEIYVPTAPDLQLLQGWRIRTATTLFDAGDNWGPPQLDVEEWMEA